MDFIYESIAWVLNLCYKVMFSNYALALLLFALIVKVLMLPLGIKQHSNSLKQASLRPREAAIVKKYNGKNDRASQQKRQMEIQELQQKAGYSQFAGCLPMLIQLPVVIIIYNVIRKPLSYICGYGKTTLKAIKEIAKKSDEIQMLSHMRDNPEAYLGIEKIGASSTDALLEKLPNFNLFGVLDLARVPSWTSLLVLIPILTFVFTFISSKLTRKLSYQSPVQQQGDDVKTSLMIMDIIMPLMSAWIAFSVPAAIGVYWIFQNLLGVLQQFIMVKIKPYPKFTEDDYKDAEREILGKKKKNKRGLKSMADPNKAHIPSIHDDDYDPKAVAEANKPKGKKSKASSMLEGGAVKEYKEEKKNDTAMKIHAEDTDTADNNEGDKE